MRYLPPLPFELAAGPFSTADARRADVPAARLRRHDLLSPHRGVRATSAPRSGVERAHAYAPNLLDGQAFSHISAALLWGMWLPTRLRADPVVDVIALAPRDRPRARGVRGHRAQQEPLALAHGLPVVSAPRTWVQLASLLTLDELVAAGDSLVRRQNPMATIGELRGALRRGERGAALVRRALPLVRAGADSPRETSLRLLIGRARMPVPEVNGRIVTRRGFTTHGDLVFRAWKVLAEYDGVQHRVSRTQFERDVIRLEELAREGWTVVRVLDVHLSEPESVAQRVAVALRDHGWR